MARSSRNRRSTKHRGNAAGMIETRGRTGRKPRPNEKGSSARGPSTGASSSRRRSRYDKPPTWKGSAIRGAIAAALVYAVIALLNKHSSPANELILVPIVLGIYVPLIHYTDTYMYRRQQRKKAGGR
jgi:hypothetical protein